MSHRFAVTQILTALVTPEVRSATESALETDVLRLFDRFRPSLLRYLGSLGLRHADGEDVVQDVFLALFEHLRRGKPQDNLRGWLFRVTHNIGLKRLNTNRRGENALDSSFLDQYADPRLNPEQHVSAIQRGERLLMVYAALPALDRGCLHLRFEGLNYREISEIMGISLGTVSKSLTRSLARLQQADRRL